MSRYFDALEGDGEEDEQLEQELAEDTFALKHSYTWNSFWNCCTGFSWIDPRERLPPGGSVRISKHSRQSPEKDEETLVFSDSPTKNLCHAPEKNYVLRQELDVSLNGRRCLC